MIRVRQATADQLTAFAAGLIDDNPARRPVDVYDRTGFPSLDTAIRLLLRRALRHQQWRRLARQKRVAKQQTTPQTVSGPSP